MSWNCFKVREKQESENGPKTMGQTLREKFPRLFSFIQRVKEYGAPSRIKKRFRRRHRVSVVPATELTDKHTDKQTKCTEMDKKGGSNPSVRRIEVAPADQSRVVDNSPRHNTAPTSGFNGDDDLVTKPVSTENSDQDKIIFENKEHPVQQHGGLNKIQMNAEETSVDDLDKLADNLVRATLDKVKGTITSPCRASSQTSDNISHDVDIDELANGIVAHAMEQSILRSSSQSLHSFYGEEQNIDEITNGLVGHTLDLSIRRSSSQSIQDTPAYIEKQNIDDIANDIVDHSLGLSNILSNSQSRHETSVYRDQENIDEITSGVVDHALDQAVLRSSSQNLQETYIDQKDEMVCCGHSSQISDMVSFDNDIDELATNVVDHALGLSDVGSSSQSVQGNHLTGQYISSQMSNKGMPEDEIDELTKDVVDHTLDPSVLMSSSQSLQVDQTSTMNVSCGSNTPEMADKILPSDDIDVVAENAVDHVLGMTVTWSSSQSLQNTNKDLADGSLDDITNGVLDQVLDVARLTSSSQSLLNGDTTKGQPADGVEPSVLTQARTHGNPTHMNRDYVTGDRDSWIKLTDYIGQDIHLSEGKILTTHQTRLQDRVIASDQHISEQKTHGRNQQVKKPVTSSRSVK